MGNRWHNLILFLAAIKGKGQFARSDNQSHFRVILSSEEKAEYTFCCLKFTRPLFLLPSALLLPGVLPIAFHQE
jgi:hypothetical protein